MSLFREIATAEFDLSHLWKASISDGEAATDSDELIFCSAVEYPTSIVSLADDMLNVGIPELKDPDLSITIYCPRNRNTLFNEKFFVDWNNNNYDEATGASNIFCNAKVLTIQRLTYKLSLENAEWKPSFAGWVVPIGMPSFTGDSLPSFRQMNIKFKKLWGLGDPPKVESPTEGVDIDTNRTSNIAYA